MSELPRKVLIWRLSWICFFFLLGGVPRCQLKWQSGYVGRHETIPSSQLALRFPRLGPFWLPQPWREAEIFAQHFSPFGFSQLSVIFRLCFAFFCNFSPPYISTKHFLIDLPLFCCRLHRGHDQLAAKRATFFPHVISPFRLSLHFSWTAFFSVWSKHARG